MGSFHVQIYLSLLIPPKGSGQTLASGFVTSTAHSLPILWSQLQGSLLSDSPNHSSWACCTRCLSSCYLPAFRLPVSFSGHLFILTTSLCLHQPVAMPTVCFRGDFCSPFLPVHASFRKASLLSPSTYFMLLSFPPFLHAYLHDALSKVVLFVYFNFCVAPVMFSLFLALHVGNTTGRAQGNRMGC